MVKMTFTAALNPPLQKINMGSFLKIFKVKWVTMGDWLQLYNVVDVVLS